MAVGVFAAVAFAAVLASSAGAALRVNPVSTTATSTGAVGLIDSTGTTTQITCASSAIAASVASATSVTVPLAGATFSTCSLGVTVTQASAWTAAFDALLATDGTITGVRLRLTIPTNGLTLRAALGCTFAVGGTVTLLGAVSPAAVPPTLAAMPALTADATLGLRVTSVTSNALCPAIALGDLARASGTWAFRPAPTFTLPETIGPSGSLGASGRLSGTSAFGSIDCDIELDGSVTAGDYVTGEQFGTFTSGRGTCADDARFDYLGAPWKIESTGESTIDGMKRFTNYRIRYKDVSFLITTPDYRCLYRGDLVGLAVFAPDPGNPIRISAVRIGSLIPTGNVINVWLSLSAGCTPFTIGTWTLDLGREITVSRT